MSLVLVVPKPLSLANPSSVFGHKVSLNLSDFPVHNSGQCAALTPILKIHAQRGNPTINNSSSRTVQDLAGSLLYILLAIVPYKVEKRLFKARFWILLRTYCCYL
jgi:hypothetical protein